MGSNNVSSLAHLSSFDLVSNDESIESVSRKKKYEPLSHFKD